MPPCGYTELYTTEKSPLSMVKDKRVSWHDVPFSHKVAFPSTVRPLDSWRKIVLILNVDGDVLHETDSWISRKILCEFSICYSSFSKLHHFSPKLTNATHTLSMIILVTECDRGGTDSGGVHQSTLLLVKHSPLPHHLSFI